MSRTSPRASVSSCCSWRGMNQCSVTVSSDAVACAVVAGSAASSCAVWGVAFDASGSGCHGGSAFSAGLSDVDSDASAWAWECCEEFG